MMMELSGNMKSFLCIQGEWIQTNQSEAAFLEKDLFLEKQKELSVLYIDIFIFYLHLNQN